MAKLEESRYGKLSVLALYLYAFSIPFEDAIVLPVIGTITRFMGIIFLLVMLPNIRLVKLRVLSFQGYTYVLVVCASLFWSIVPDYLGAFRVIQWLFSTLLIANIVYDNPRIGDKTLTYFTYGTTIVGILTLAFMRNSMEGELRASAFENQASNYLAITLCVGWGYAFYKLTNKEYLLGSFLLNLGIIFILTFACFATGTRAGWLSIIGILVLYNLLRFSLYSLFGSILVLVSVVILLNFTPILKSNLDNRIEKAQNDKGAGRQTIWIVGKTIIENNLLLGVGYRNFYYAFDQNAVDASEISSDDYMRLTQRSEGIVVSGSGAHNTFIGTLAEIGLIGFLAYVYWFLKLFLIPLRYPVNEMIKYLSLIHI